MGRSAIPLDTIWPNGSDPKTLVCVRAQCSVADLFSTVFGEADLSEQLHKQRGDTDLVESPWYSTKDDLPAQLYIWQVTDPLNKPSATLRHRKVRFESPPTALASKPFQNEESQVITELYPDTLYVVEAVSSTSAPYGDKFNVYFRYIFRAGPPTGAAGTDGGSSPTVGNKTGSSSSVLHIQFHVEWLPAMNRMMRPVVGKAVDAGVRSTFKIFRTVLGTLQPVVDIRESEVPAAGPPAVMSYEAPARGALGEVEAGAGPVHHVPVQHPHPAQAAGFAPGVGPSPDLMSVLTQQLVYKDQVILLADLLGAGLRTVSASDLGAQLLAAALTIWLISILVAALRAWKTLCGGNSGGGGLLWPLRLTMCWPLELVDLPDSTAEVLTSLAMVAAINWAVIRSSEAVVRFLSKKHPGLLAAARRGGSGTGGGGRGGDVIGGVPFSQTPLGARGSSGGAGGSSIGRAPSGCAGVNHTQPSAATASGTGSFAAVATPGAASAASATAAGDGGGKEKDKGKGSSVAGGTSFFAAALGVATGRGPPSASSATHPKAMRAAPAPKQFTAAQLRQLELGQVTSSSKKMPAAAAPPPPAQVSSAVPAAAAMADAWAAEMPTVMVAPLGAAAAPPRAPSPLPPPRVAGGSPTGPSGSASPSRKDSVLAVDTPAAAATAGARNAAVAEPAAAKPGDTDGSAGGETALQPLLFPLPTATSPPMAAPSNSPSAPPPPLPPPPAPPAQLPVGSTAAPLATTTTAAGAGGGMSTTNTFANMFTREGMDAMAESLRSAFRWDTAKTSDIADLGSPDSTSSPSASAPFQQYHLTKLKARSEAGGALASDAAAVAASMAAAAARRRGSAAAGGGGGGLHYSFTGGATVTPSMYSVQSDVPLLALGEGEEEGYGSGGGGDDDEGYYGEVEPALVVEEVFENERFQPFRGWGHQWPGHFLPSDRVGHWSDRQGKPGGSASMVFEQVVPQLPRGWKWLEEDWQVDLEGLDVEAVDADGWTYALDFYLLKYPPPPQGGKCSLKHFVRRRRCYRTRVRIEGRSTRSSGDYMGPLAPPFTRISEDGGAAAEGSGTSDGNPAMPNLPAAVPGTTDVAAAAVAAIDPLAVTDQLSDGIPSAPQPEPRPSRHPLEDIAGGHGDGGEAAGVELQPPVPSAASPAALGGCGGGGVLPRPRSAAEGLAEVLALQDKQQHEQSRRSARSSSSSSGPAGGVTAATAAVQATLDLFTTGAGTAGIAADGLAREGVRQGSGDAAGGSSGGTGRSAVQHGELFVLSPKTEVMSDDPLGALAAEEERGLSGSRNPSPPPPPAPEPPVGTAEVASTAVVAAGGSDAAASGGGSLITTSGGPNPSLGSSQETNTIVPPRPAVIPAAATDTASVPETAAADDSARGPAPGPVAAAATVLVAEERAAAAVVTEAPAGATTPLGVEESGDGSSGGAAAATAAATGPVFGRREGMRASRSALSPAKAKLGVAGAELTDGVLIAAVDGCGVAEGPIIAAELVE